MAVYTDNFDRPDNPSLGANWTVPAGMNSPTIITNLAAGGVSAPSSHVAIWSANAFSASQYSKAVFFTVDIARYTLIGVRMGGPNGQGYYIRSNGTDSYIVYTNLAGTDTLLQNVSSSFTGLDIIEIRAIGSSISAYKNSVQIGTTQVDTNITSGSAGIRLFDNNDKINDWEGGDLSDAVTIPIYVQLVNATLQSAKLMK